MIWVCACIAVSVIGYYSWPEKRLPKNARIDAIIVWKSKRRMQVFENGKLLKTYRIALGKNPVGHKAIEGDGRTPEGSYRIDARSANSKFRKNLGISYPNRTDSENAEALGKSPGGDIKIHGLRNGRAYRTPVRLGVSNFDWFEVAEGLSAGDEIIASDMREYESAPELRIK